MLVLLRATSPAEFVVAVTRRSSSSRRSCAPRRVRSSGSALLAQRLVAVAAALGLYQLVVGVADSETDAVVLGALALAGVGALAVDEVVFAFQTRRVDLSWHGRSAQLALVTSGMLMAVGYDGLEGHGGMGLWGPLLFSVPLLAAWYSFERLAAIRRTYTQTLRALSIVPELGGLVREGHAARVAGLSLEMGRDLGLDARELEYLEAAALLHHIGHVCLDDPSVLGRPVESSEVAQASAEMLRQAEFLAPAAELLSPDPHPFGAGARSMTSVSGQVLRVAERVRRAERRRRGAPRRRRGRGALLGPRLRVRPAGPRRARARARAAPAPARRPPCRRTGQDRGRRSASGRAAEPVTRSMVAGESAVGAPARPPGSAASRRRVPRVGAPTAPCASCAGRAGWPGR